MSDELIAESLIGDEAEKFMESVLGKKIIEMVEDEIVDGQRALEEVNPSDQPAIEKIQNDIRQARRFPKYLTDLLTKGEEAMRAYKQQQQDD